MLLRADVIRIRPEDWRQDWKLSLEMLGFSLPLAIQFIVIAVSGIVLQFTINGQGSLFRGRLYCAQ